VAALKVKPGRDIWLFGGGSLCRALLDAGLVDSVEVGVIPVLLGAGVPLVAPGPAMQLALVDQKSLPKSGIMMLAYAVTGAAGPPPRIDCIKATTPGAQMKRRARDGKSTRSDKPTRQ
jgi:hypothetical protein